MLPYEDTIYLADSKHAPYGLKSKNEIIRLCKKNTELLLQHECKIIVVACNTATTNAIKELRRDYSVPFIGIEPAIKPAALKTDTRVIGILATRGTLSSQLFSQTSQTFAQGIRVIEQHGDGLVELIETGKLDDPKLRALLQLYLTPMMDAGIDYLVLGCSHYPFLMPLLIELLPTNVKIIDSGEAVARQTLAVLDGNSMLSSSALKGTSRFFTNGDPKVVSQFIGNNYSIEYLDF